MGDYKFGREDKGRLNQLAKIFWSCAAWLIVFSLECCQSSVFMVADRGIAGVFVCLAADLGGISPVTSIVACFGVFYYAKAHDFISLPV